MSQKKKTILVLVTIVLMIGIFFIIKWSISNEKEVKKGNHSSESTNINSAIDEQNKSSDGLVTYVNGDDKKIEGKIEVMVVGTVGFSENENVQYQSIKWTTAIPKNVKFILVQQDEEITKEKQTIIKQWIKDKKTVLFYGPDVKPEKVKEKTGLDIEIINVEANVTFSYLLYGYGYSEQYKKEMPLFLGVNNDRNSEAKINTFLIKKKHF